MATLTKGHLSVFPLRVTVSSAIEDAFRQIAEAAYSETLVAQNVDHRWGTPRDDSDNLVGRLSTVPPTPTYVPSSHEYTTLDQNVEMLNLRLYWYELDRRALEVVGEAPPPEPRSISRLQAADLMITASEHDGSHLVLVTTRNRNALDRHIIPALTALYRGVDDGAVVYSDVSPLALGDDDIFLWILARSHNSPEITGDISIQNVRALSTEDSLRRSAALSRGVDLDRAEFLALIATQAKLGPAKFSLSDEQLGLESDIELFSDGGFTVLVGESWYRAEPLSRDQLGPQIVPDLAFSVLPRIRAAYSADSAWRSTGRDQYRADALSALRQI